MISYIRTSSPDKPAEYLYSAIRQRLERGNKVLWLVPGGSSVTVAVKTAELLAGAPELENLTITLTDERYGLPAHDDSNWQQLLGAGFSLNNANMQPVLTGKSMDDMTKTFGSTLKKGLDAPGFKIGLFGMGSDGHTSGILPGSPAIKSRDYAASYDGGRYKRITTTPAAISKLDEAVLYALGRDKWPTIKKLQTDAGVDVQPAQILKTVPKLTVFSDYEGGEL